MKSILKSILKIEKGNKFLKYIVDRIQQENYRGLHISQHNRYDLDYVESIISSIHKITNGNYFEIPRGDYSERTGGVRKYKIKDYPEFKEIVDSVKKLEGRGTYNSIKKNFFVDFHRMGIIERYDKNKMLVNPYKRTPIFFAKLTNKSYKFLNAKNIFEKYRIFTDFLDTLFQEHLSNLADLIYNSDYKESQISVYEFMFILSDTELSNNEKIELLNSYNELKNHQKEKLIELLKKYADPDNFSGDKTQKRDFHNWINEAQQILSLMKQTSYFQVDKDHSYFTLNIGSVGIFSEQVIKRSARVKNEYFKIHSIEKQKDFELHHIIPISRARNKKEVDELDNVDNLIYLHKTVHSKITNNKNKNLYLYINELVANFCDFEANQICSTNGSDSLYSEEKKIIKKMDKHNKLMIKKIYEFENKINCTEHCV